MSHFSRVQIIQVTTESNLHSCTLMYFQTIADHVLFVLTSGKFTVIFVSFNLPGHKFDATEIREKCDEYRIGSLVDRPFSPLKSSLNA